MAERKSKILVVDDEPHIVKVIKDRLAANNYNVITATDGQEALAQVAKEKPDLIILDLMMPGMDGFAVAEKLKTDPLTKQIPVIVLTALVQEATAKKALELGAKGYLTKPFKPEAVLFTVQQFLKEG